MTRALPFTQSAVRRAVEGARSAGMPVAAVSVRPDGTIVIHSTDSPPLAPADPAAPTGMEKQWAF